MCLGGETYRERGGEGISTAPLFASFSIPDSLESSPLAGKQEVKEGPPPAGDSQQGDTGAPGTIRRRGREKEKQQPKSTPKKVAPGVVGRSKWSLQSAAVEGCTASSSSSNRV